MAEQGRPEGTAASSVELIVDAEILDPGLPAPRPGGVYLIPIMRYRVLQVVHGTYPHPEIFVGHDQPDLQAPAFQPGVRHRLHLTRRFPAYASPMNPFRQETHGLGVFFCVSFEVIA
jgi:hypothetical protein